MTTRDDMRAKCIEAMADNAIEKIGRGWFTREYWIEVFTAAFDSLHGIALVVPPQETDNMLEAGLFAYEDGTAVDLYRAMSAAGDLTNAPEKI